MMKIMFFSGPGGRKWEGHRKTPRQSPCLEVYHALSQIDKLFYFSHQGLCRGRVILA
jgi:hypothetical protein